MNIGSLAKSNKQSEQDEITIRINKNVAIHIWHLLHVEYNCLDAESPTDDTEALNDMMCAIGSALGGSYEY